MTSFVLLSKVSMHHFFLWTSGTTRHSYLHATNAWAEASHLRSLSICRRSIWISLIRRLDAPLRVGLETGASVAARMQHSSVELAHWLRGLLDVPDIAASLSAAGVDCEALRQQLDGAIADLGRGDGASLVLSQNILATCREAWLLSSLEQGRNSITLGDILAALVDDSSLRAYLRGAAPVLLRLDRNALDAMRVARRSQAQQMFQEAASATASSDGNEFLRSTPAT